MMLHTVRSIDSPHVPSILKDSLRTIFATQHFLSIHWMACWKMTEICNEIVWFVRGVFHNFTDVYRLNPRIWLVVKGNRNNDPIIHIGLAWAGFELTHHRQCRLLFVVNFFNSTQIKFLTLSMIFGNVWHIQSCKYCYCDIFICDEIP